jgi:lactate dehydrogenase-like 2-hydroxyacid dehydrogenase
VEAATELRIQVTHSPTESNWGAVAEGTIAIMLCLLMRLRGRDTHLKHGGNWRDERLEGQYPADAPKSAADAATATVNGIKSAPTA